MDKEETVACKLALGKICIIQPNKVKKLNHDDQSLSSSQSVLCLRENNTIKYHVKNVFHERYILFVKWDLANRH